MLKFSYFIKLIKLDIQENLNHFIMRILPPIYVNFKISQKSPLFGYREMYMSMPING